MKYVWGIIIVGGVVYSMYSAGVPAWTLELGGLGLASLMSIAVILDEGFREVGAKLTAIEALLRNRDAGAERIAERQAQLLEDALESRKAKQSKP